MTVATAISLNSTQADFVRDTSPVCAYIGGWGSGKTFAGAFKKLGLAMASPECQSFAIEPTYTMLRDIMVPAMEEMCEKLGIPYIFKKQRMIMTLPNGHEILFRSGDKPERLEGIDAADVWVDEGAGCKDEVWLRVKGRLREKRAANIQLNITTTPDGCKGWLFDTFGGSDGLPYHQASTDENKENLGESYLELLDELPPDLQDQYRRGEFVDIRTPRIYKEFTREKNVKRGKLDPALQVWVWLDFNINPGMHFCAAQEVNIVRNGKQQRALHVIKDWFLPRASTEDVATALDEWTAKHDLMMRPRIICDAAGRAKQSATGWSDVDILEMAGYRCDWTYVKTQSDKHNPVKVEAHNGRLLVDPSCKLVIDSMFRYSYREGSNAPQDDKWKHMADCVGYGVMYLRPIRARRTSRG